MAKLLKLRRGTTTQHGSFTGAEGEVTVDTDKETLVVHDGSTAGGHPVAAEDMANVSSASIAARLGNDSIAVGKIAAGTLPSDVKVTDANVSGNLTIESADIVDGTIVNADINASAAIAPSKLASGTLPSGITVASANIVDGTIVNADINASAAIGLSKLATGALPSGITVASANIVDGTITNGDVNAGAAIAGTKVSPDFGSQSIVTTGNILINGDSTGASNHRLTLGSASGGDLKMYHDGTNSYLDNDTGTLIVQSDGGGLKLLSEGNIILRDNDDTTNMMRCLNGAQTELYHNGSKKFETTSGGASVSGNLDVSSGADVTGNLTVSGTINSGAHTVTGNIAVSGTVDGRDVASDGTKLDGIESGATADQSAAEIRTLVDTASDCNVFTNALQGKLNGIETGATADQTASEIVSLVSGQNITPATVYTNSDSGKIGRDSTDYISFGNNSYMDIHINGSNEFRFEADGDFQADGDVYAFSTTTASDENLKKDITIVTDAVSKVEALKGVTFKWKENDGESAGVIAQDVEKVLPEVVKTVNNPDGNTYKAVNYAGINSILIEAIKELSARIKVLEAK